MQNLTVNVIYRFLAGPALWFAGIVFLGGLALRLGYLCSLCYSQGVGSSRMLEFTSRVAVDHSLLVSHHSSAFPLPTYDFPLPPSPFCLPPYSLLVARCLLSPRYRTFRELEKVNLSSRLAKILPEREKCFLLDSITM
jgi:hypothetical protein